MVPDRAVTSAGIDGAALRQRRRGLLGRAGVRALLRGVLLAFSLTASYWLAYQLRFDFQPVEPHQDALRITLPLMALASLALVLLMGSHRRSWSHWGSSDAYDLARLAGLSAILGLALQGLVLNLRAYPRSVFLLHPMIAFGLGAILRWFAATVRRGRQSGGEQRRGFLLVGAGETGGQLLAQISRSTRIPLRADGIVDDDPLRQGTFVHGVPVLGTIDDLVDVARSVSAEEIIVATPSATGEQLRRITDHCRQSGLPYRILPRTEEVLAGSIQWKQVREVRIEDLLRREPVRIDAQAIAALVAGRTVLVSGAAGSIGSEIARQLAAWGPLRLVLVDRAETGLFHLQSELTTQFGDVPLAIHIGDVANRTTARDLLARHRPEVVIHAAAYKHVPMVEFNVREGIANNAFGTEALAEAAGETGCHTFVLISTDKAVNPTSVMGASKRLAELVLQSVQRRHPGTRYAAVRFGNVLGSQGSVIPVFREQIAAGGPVTVTHPEMRRYFMTIPEAARLVLQAATFGESGAIYILDMGDPVRIVDLARDMIRLSGLEPGVDVEIRFTGVRPGEKLFEELAFDGERMERTDHKQVFRGRLVPADDSSFRADLDVLRASLWAEGEDAARARLRKLVPESAIAAGVPPDRP